VACDGGKIAGELLANRRDGRIKMFSTTRALSVRARWRSLFELGDYVPLGTAGGRRDCVFAFARRLDDRAVIACVPRLIASILSDAEGAPIGRSIWADTYVELPADDDAFTRLYRDAFTGAAVEPRLENGRPVLAASELFDRFPIALLEPVDG